MEFDEAFHRLLGHEGGYSDHPDDPGGKTMWGVTERVARAAGYTGDMRAFPVDMAKSIYRRQYWTPARCDELPAAVRFDLFDAAVNSGVGQAVKWLQEALGVTADGSLGPMTLAAANAANPQALVARMVGERLEAMTDMRGWASFSRGWGKRLASNLKNVGD